MTLAETEAADYATDMTARYLGFAQAYSMTDQPAQGAELFSLLRDSPLAPHAYLDTFFDTGQERQGIIEAP